MGNGQLTSTGTKGL